MRGGMGRCAAAGRSLLSTLPRSCIISLIRRGSLPRRRLFSNSTGADAVGPAAGPPRRPMLSSAGEEGAFAPAAPSGATRRGGDSPGVGDAADLSESSESVDVLRPCTCTPGARCTRRPDALGDERERPSESTPSKPSSPSPCGRPGADELAWISESPWPVAARG